MSQAISLLKQTFQDFQRHRAQWLAAAIAYFTVFAIAPLIIVVVQMAGFVLGQHQAVLNEIYGYLRSSAGSGVATAIQTIVSATFNQRHGGMLTQIVGWAMFVLATIGLVASFKQALNSVWEVEPAKESLLMQITSRAVSFGIILVLAVVLLASLGLNAILTAAANALVTVSPVLPLVLKVLDFIVTFAVIAGIFALIFEVLPDCKVQWRDVWIGALITSLLFVIGQFLLGWYLGRAGIGSTYGAFGSLVIFLLWTNYTAQTVLFGAEFTHVYARRFGSLCRSEPEKSHRLRSGSSAVA